MIILLIFFILIPLDIWVSRGFQSLGMMHVEYFGLGCTLTFLVYILKFHNSRLKEGGESLEIRLVLSILIWNILLNLFMAVIYHWPGVNLSHVPSFIRVHMTTPLLIPHFWLAWHVLRASPPPARRRIFMLMALVGIAHPLSRIIIVTEPIWYFRYNGLWDFAIIGTWLWYINYLIKEEINDRFPKFIEGS